MKIVSYNVHKAVGLDGRRDPARILRVLTELDADVVVLQEADRRLGQRPAAVPGFLIAQETDFEVVDLAQTEVSLGWHGNAVLVRRGLAVGEARHLDLPGLEPRGAVMVQVDGVHVVGTHLGLMRRWRRRQMQAILDHLGAAARTAVIAGDFNEWSAVRGYEPWDGMALVMPGASYPAVRPIGELDGFACGAALEVVDVGVMRARDARIASDHLPVWAEVRAR